MKRQDQPNQDPSDTETKKSCPTIIQEDVTRSINEQCISYHYSFLVGRNARSQQFLPHYEDSVIQKNDTSKRQSRASALKSSGFGEKPQQESKIDHRIINQGGGTNFGCEEVVSIQLSMEEASYRSGSLRNRSNRNSQQQLEEPRSARKFKKQEKQNSSNIENYRQNEIKQEVLNVLLAGAQDTGKSRFKQCFKGKQRKSDEAHIKSRTREIKYEKMADQNLLNKRNNVCFIDLPGFACNQEDKYLRQIQQYATVQWHNYQIRPDDDKRIHCCLYFMRGPRIKHSDINMMKKLSQMFNIIPVIAKSDHYKKEQILEMKEEFDRIIAAAGHIELYDLEQYFLLKLGTDRINEALYSKFGKVPPFAIASSTDRQSPQSSYFVRNYPWGKVQIQNEQHTDFKRLCDLLTSDVRTQFLAKMIPLPLRVEQERVQEATGEIGEEIRHERDERNENSFCLGKLKRLLVITTLVGVVGGVWFYPRLREAIMDAPKVVST